MYQHIYWDFDGTLFNTYPAMVGALKKALQDQGHVVQPQQILAQMKVTLSHAIRHYALQYSLSYEDLRAQVDTYRAQDEPMQCAPYPGIPELCRAIAKNGGKNYLYTHRDRSAIQMMRRYHMLDDFTDFVTLEDGFERKPSPQALLYLLGKHGVSPQQAVMIGDRALDVQSGQNAGMAGCFFALDGGTPNPGANHVVYTLAQLYQMLQLPCP